MPPGLAHSFSRKIHIDVSLTKVGYSNWQCLVSCSVLPEIGSMLVEKADLAQLAKRGLIKIRNLFHAWRDSRCIFEGLRLLRTVIQLVLKLRISQVRHRTTSSNRQVEDVEIFKVCLDYWCALTTESCRLNPFTPPSPPITSFSCRGHVCAKEHPRRKLYKDTDQICVLS
ncbi:unnamed protein product [Cylicocyclus nassatus]|uniref:Uncharacterized protein n=1 Tax=Cylicocyclus nassatus TaxID=53992 RepID=A0AA36GLK3_CYLNA|nr:unnamed protein product [Cylicocyclus nassatus]